MSLEIDIPIEINLSNPTRIVRTAKGKRIKYEALEVSIKIGNGKRKTIIYESARNGEGIINYSHFLHPDEIKELTRRGKK